MKVYLSRYFRVLAPIYGLMIIGSLLASILIVDVSVFQKVTARTVTILATCAFTKVILWDRRNFLMTVHIEPKSISSKLLWNKCCSLPCDRPIYLFFFREFVELGPPELPYIAISNSPVKFDAASKKLLSFDRRSVIILPDTEKVRFVLVHCIHSENRREQNTPPPLEESRKSEEATSIAKREKPDSPPPFTGKWNGRF